MLLKAHLFVFTGHKCDNFSFDVLIVEEHPLEKFVESGKLVICLDAAIASRILHDAIIGHIESLFVLS